MSMSLSRKAKRFSQDQPTFRLDYRLCFKWSLPLSIVFTIISTHIHSVGMYLSSSSLYGWPLLIFPWIPSVGDSFFPEILRSFLLTIALITLVVDLIFWGLIGFLLVDIFQRVSFFFRKK
jgi:hypothetical protein